MNKINFKEMKPRYFRAFTVVFVVCCFVCLALHGLCACSASGQTEVKQKTEAQRQAELEIEQQLAKLSTLRYIDDIVKARRAVAESVNYEALLASPLRDQFLHTWLHLYPYDEDLLVDGKTFVVGTLADTVGTIRKPLVGALCNALLEDGRVEVAAILAAYSFGFPVEQGENSGTAMRLLRQITLPGQQAPEIKGLPAEAQPGKTGKKTLLVFYETDCTNCLSTLSRIISQYNELQQQGIEVISISVDRDTTAAATYAANLPWPHNICDGQGFNGENIVEWGVVFTPTLFMIDAEGKVETEEPEIIINGAR